MSISPRRTSADELDALGPQALRRASADAAAMFTADVSAAAPATIDPVPAVIDADSWEELAAGLTQRARLLDALYADLYGPRTVFATDVAPTAELLADPTYLRPAVGIPARGPHHLFALTCTVGRTQDGSWTVLEDVADVPAGAGSALEIRRVLSRCAPTLYRSTELRRLHPFFDRIRTSLHHRGRSDGRAGRAVVLVDDDSDPLRAFDQHWFANLLGAPVVSASDLQTGSGTLSLRLPGLDADAGDGVDTLVRLVPSRLLDPLDLGPTPLGGITALVEAARCGDVEILNPLGAGLLENPALRRALPDLCRQILHEDLALRSPDPGAELATLLQTAPSLDPDGGDRLIDRPVTMRLLVVAGEDGFEVLPGGVARTVDEGTPALKDVWVTVPPTSTVPTPAVQGRAPSPAAATAMATLHEMAGAPTGPVGTTSRTTPAAYPAMTRSIGSDLFWFGRYLERVDFTARLLRTVLDATNDLGSEQGCTAHTALSVLLNAVTDVTTTYPGFREVDLADTEGVQTEITSLLSDVARPGSLAQSFSSLAHTTRTLRDLVSDDIWPVIARMRSRIRALDRPGTHPLESGLTDVVDGCLTLSGAVTDSMPRSLGWDLTDSGRRIERLLGLLSLLRATLGRRRTDAAEARITGAVAVITESGASYRRYYHAAVQSELLLELLLTDMTLPRSIAFQLDRLGTALDRLPEATPSPELRAPLTALRSRVHSWSPQELLRPVHDQDGAPTALLEEADGAIASLRELATALENLYFRPTEATSPWGFDDV